MRPRLPVISLLLVGSGCVMSTELPAEGEPCFANKARAASLPWTVSTDSETLSAQDKLLIDRAIDNWNEWTNDILPEFFKHGSGNHRDPGVVYIVKNEELHPDHIGEALGYRNSDGNIYSCLIRLDESWFFIRPTVNAYRLIALVAHEMGHCLNLAHDPPGLLSIMTQTTSSTARLTANDHECLAQEER